MMREELLSSSEGDLQGWGLRRSGGYTDYEPFCVPIVQGGRQCPQLNVTTLQQGWLHGPQRRLCSTSRSGLAD